MKISGKFLGLMLGLMFLSIGLLVYYRNKPLRDEVVPPSVPKRAHGQSSMGPSNNGHELTKATLFTAPDNARILFQDWAQELRAPVTFLNPPNFDNEGLFCVINPEYQFLGKRVLEVVEDGYLYDHALTGQRGAVLFGKSNGRPPWNHKVAELFIDNGELKLRHRISFGGNKGVRTRLLLDLEEKSVVSKIGIAMDEMVRGSPWGYPPISFDETVISSEEIENTPLQTLKANWIEVDTNFNQTEIFKEPARVIWLQFQEGGRNIKRISN